MLFAAATTAMHPANSPLAAWPWLAMALKDIDGHLIEKIATRIPKHVVDQLAGRWRVVQQKRREAADKALAWETVRRGLTPATERARVAWGNHRVAMYKAKHVLNAARKERDELWEAARAGDQRLRDAQAVCGAILRGTDPTGQADTEARTARKEEIKVTSTQAKSAQDETKKAERVFLTELRQVYRVDPRQETALALARLVSIPENELMVLMGLRKKRELNNSEREAFVRRAMAGERVTVLIEEYHISHKEAYLILAKHKNGETGTEHETGPTIT